MNLYAIGDIHGCLDALDKMLAKIEADRAGEPAKVVFLGDYTDRGPDSAGVVQRLIDLPKEGDVEYVFIRGNHDIMFIDWVRQTWGGTGDIFWQNGGDATTQSYVNAKIPMPDHIPFMENTQWYHRHGEFLFVHAGLDPHVSLEEQNNYDLVWNRDFNDYDGEYPENVFVVHGHTPVKNVDRHKNQINIDTGCVFRWMGHDGYNGLTCVKINSRTDIQFIQTREAGSL